MNGAAIENYIEAQYRELQTYGLLNPEFSSLYVAIKHKKLSEIFSALHKQFEVLFQRMNDRLPTDESGAHFWAQESRELLQVVNMALSLRRTLKDSAHEFEIDKYYSELLASCQTFLKKSGGSSLPPNMEAIPIYYSIPVFLPATSQKITRVNNEYHSSLKLIGEGSYAQIFKYKDDFYDREFAVKRAKKNLDQIEIERFKREFWQMRQLSSPYVLEVYKFDEAKNEYRMELMDLTLDRYISTNNSKLTSEQRKGIAFQVIRGLGYLHSKEIIHRDISPTNILIKKYEDLVVAKIADFGLVKIPGSNLTSMNTEFKGYFNDPALRTEGWNNYQMPHEIYALTMLLYFIMTGRTDVSKISDSAFKEFVHRGLNPDKAKRFRDIKEISDAFRLIVR